MQNEIVELNESEMQHITGGDVYSGITNTAAGLAAGIAAAAALTVATGGAALIVAGIGFLAAEAITAAGIVELTSL